jgi:branched-chain amino acid transport system substrate-binding protein
MLEVAIKKAGSIDADKLRPAFETVEIDDIKGKVAMRACDHQAVQRGFMVKVGRKEGFTDPVPELIATFPADEVTPACRQMTYDS